MNKEIHSANDWKENIINFFEMQVKESKLSKARKYIDDQNAKISKEINIDKKKIIKNKKKDKEKELNILRVEAPSTEIRDWIEKTIKNLKASSSIIKATHVLKFSHTSSTSEGLLLNESFSNEPYLGTSSQKKGFKYDLAHNNGNLVTISRFLALELSNKSIIDFIIQNNFDFLIPFKKNKEQLLTWKNGFSKLIEEREIKTADKAKQIYFPLLEEKIKNKQNDIKYHLIVPLFSSSLAEGIYTNVNRIKFDDEQKNVRSQKKGSNNGSSLFHNIESITFPDIGIQGFGGQFPRNVSMLNANRGGKCYLFSASPPTWQNQYKPPIDKKSLFIDLWNENIRDNINYLRNFLLRFEDVGLSIRNPDRLKWVEGWISNIIDDFLYYTSSIQKNFEPGWSDTKNIILKKEHQFLLDPFNIDTNFQTERHNSNWENVVCIDFSNWINLKLIGKDRQFTPQNSHSKLWSSQMENELREFNFLIESDSKFRSI